MPPHSWLQTAPRQRPTAVHEKAYPRSWQPHHAAVKETAIAHARRPGASRFFATVLVLALLALGGCGALGWHEPIEEVTPPPRPSFDRAQIRRGQILASLGDCSSCHSPRNGPPFAGGVPVPTPFGTVYGTNITPEPQTGIGKWSEAAFRRALREGVSRDGHLLYPAFPYNHFTHLSDDDIRALYAFVMTRDPVQAKTPANRLMFPLQFRPLMAAWNLLYLHKGPIAEQASQSAEWNRGAYLVDSVGHCAACHSPHNALGAEKKDAYLDGGEAEGWHATALNAKSPSPAPWTADALTAYLRTGIVPDHAITAGPMEGVVHNLSHADPADLRAMAVYIEARMGPPDAARQARETAARRKAAQPSLAAVQPTSAAVPEDASMLALGQVVYANSCAECHDLGRQFSSDTALRLPLAVALYLPDPRNLIHIIRRGIEPAEGQAGRWMPPFEGSLTDEQLAALVVWLRRQGTDAPPWKDVLKTVKESGDAP
jgi:mono/diheme cytochrome c family protein